MPSRYVVATGAKSPGDCKRPPTPCLSAARASLRPAPGPRHFGPARQLRRHGPLPVVSGGSTAARCSVNCTWVLITTSSWHQSDYVTTPLCSARYSSAQVRRESQCSLQDQAATAGSARSTCSTLAQNHSDE